MLILTIQPHPVSQGLCTYTDNSAIGRALTYNQILSQVIHSLPCIIHESIPEALHSAVNSLRDWLTCHAIKQGQSRLQLMQLPAHLPA